MHSISLVPVAPKMFRQPLNDAAIIKLLESSLQYICTKIQMRYFRFVKMQTTRFNFISNQFLETSYRDLLMQFRKQPSTSESLHSSTHAAMSEALPVTVNQQVQLILKTIQNIQRNIKLGYIKTKFYLLPLGLHIWRANHVLDPVECVLKYTKLLAKCKKQPFGIFLFSIGLS